MPYNAFISYSHAMDGQLAPAIQKALHRIAKPWYKQKALHVFRDETSLTATPHLWNNIEKALGEAEFLIVLASPTAAHSKWVAKEVEYWLQNKSLDTLILAVTEGDIWWDNDTNAFDWSKTTAVPPILKGKFPEEPFYVDFREVKTSTDLSLNNPEFKKRAVHLAATLRHTTAGDLVGEDVRQHRRTMRIRNFAIAVLSLLLLVSILTSILAVNQSKIAQEQARIARKQTDFALQQQAIAQDSAASARQQRTIAKENEQDALRNALLAQQQEAFAKAQQFIAEEQRDSARMERDIAEANRISALALNVSDDQPFLSLRLADHAYQMQNPPCLMLLSH
jgi:hypothetical protein